MNKLLKIINQCLVWSLTDMKEIFWFITQNVVSLEYRLAYKSPHAEEGDLAPPVATEECKYLFVKVDPVFTSLCFVLTVKRRCQQKFCQKYERFCWEFCVSGGWGLNMKIDWRFLVFHLSLIPLKCCSLPQVIKIGVAGSQCQSPKS